MSIATLFMIFCTGILSLLIYFFIPLKIKFSYGFASGIFIGAILVSTGSILIYLNDIRNQHNWIGHQYKDSSYLVVRLMERLSEKANSFKALAKIESVYQKDSQNRVKGNIIIYFKKDPAPNQLVYGSMIVFNRSIQPIQNSGNPGAFDYQRYCLFQGITHQVYLQTHDYSILHSKKENALAAFIFQCRSWTIRLIRKFISGEKEQGLAEALLIGYKDDLDKKLVQSYSNTGVVHVIAISGLHLGLIYSILLMLTKPFKKIRGTAWLRFLIITGSLWIFTLIAGAQPSVLRSAVMFTCIAAGEMLSKRGSIYNTLALSAFMLLCYNPFWLWDLGFQLSYAAVLSIILFFKPVYNWFYFKYFLIDVLWKLNAVTISAQLLTLPISIYHFHQLPTLFLFSNMIAVPLSSIILIGEIILCSVSFIEPIAFLLGRVLHLLIWLMNSFIEKFDEISFSTWENLFINTGQAILLSACILLFSAWLMHKKNYLLKTGLALLLFFVCIRTWSFVQAGEQEKIIVYNIPRNTAIDLIKGHAGNFIGDSLLVSDEALNSFHLQPSRVMHRVKNISQVPFQNTAFNFAGKRILVLDSTIFNHSTMFNLSTSSAPPIDLLILSKNPRLYIADLARVFNIRQIVIDGSVPAWKSRLWKKDCDSLRIKCFDVKENGAFAMNL